MPADQESPNGGADATDTLTRRVIAAIAKTQSLPEDSISPDSTFEELGFDSLDGFEILFSLEEEFDLEISDDEARDIASVREAVECLRPLLADQLASEAAGGDAAAGGAPKSDRADGG